MKARLPQLAAVLVALVAAACAAPPPAVTTSLRDPEETPRLKVQLTAAEESAILRAMRRVADGHRAVSPPGPQGVRFSDAELAMEFACEAVQAAVEDTVIEREDGPRSPAVGYRFRVRTVEDWPGEIRIRARPAPDVYAAEGWIGRFPDDPNRTARRDQLLVAFDRAMSLLGQQRRLMDLDERVERRRGDAEAP